MSEDSKKALVLPVHHDGHGNVRGFLIDEAGVHAGEFRKVEEGKPIMGDLLQVQPIPGSPVLMAEVTPMPGTRPVQDAPRSGPAMVNSPEFRAGWERIFGKKHPVAEA